MMTKKSLLPIILFVFCLQAVELAQAQDLQYKLTELPSIEKGGVVVMRDIQNDFAPTLQSLEAPSPSGASYNSFLLRQKKLAERRWPRKIGGGSTLRGTALAPIIGRSFEGNSDLRGIPLDTHLAISDSGQVISVINSDILVSDTAGTRIFRTSLGRFFQPLRPISSVFDPKIHYDPIEDRFVLTALAFTSTQSHIYIAFSQSNDASGAWNLYTIDGNPFVTGTFFDYPMLTISPDNVFLTGNSVRRGEPWQTGFEESLIYQIKKRTGYAGQSLRSFIWSDISAWGSYIRNICPVKGGAALYGPNQYFLSNRNFDLQNDTILMFEITDTVGSSSPPAFLSLLKSDTNYGLAPSAQQMGTDTLATNDSRVLDAFLFNNTIQFVSNTINTANGRPSIYHGTITDVNSNPQVTGHIISHDSLEFGYPSISFTGSSDTLVGDQDAIIFMDYSSAFEFPGTGAVFYSNQKEYSNFVRSKRGIRRIDALNSTFERWGDYTGNQRKYNSSGTVWTMGTYGANGNSARSNGCYITEFKRPTWATAVDKSLASQASLKAWPIPARDWVDVEFKIPKGANIDIRLVDVSGKIIEIFADYKPTKSGLSRFSFSTSPLRNGIYFLQIKINEAPSISKKIIITK